MAANPLQSTFDHCYYNQTVFKDDNSTALASQVITTSFSMFFYLGVVVLSALGVCFKSFVKLFSSPAIFIFFLIGVIMTSANVFNTSGELSIMLYRRIVSVFLVGVVFVLFGAFLFFKKPNGASDYPTLGQHQPSMGLLLTIITLPLSATELLILMEVQASRDKTTENRWLILVVQQVLFVVQKFIQVAVYVWLRDQTVCSAYRKNAQFYFRVLAFFNFILWVDSQVNLDQGVYVYRAKQSYGEWFVVLYALYKALLVDYRLVCSLLFLEHSIEVENEAGSAEMVGVGNSENEISIQVGITSSGRQWRHVGFIVGFSCLLVPFICALYYVRKLHLTVYDRAVATFLGSLIIIVSGMVLLLKNNLEFDKRIKESKSVKVMVCCLAAVGFSSLMFTAAIAVFWADKNHPYHDYRWAGAELVSRGLTTLFLMYVFLKVDARALPLQNPGVKINHFLVPVLTLGIIADFAACLVDQQIGPLDCRFRLEIKDQSLLLLHNAGSTMHLGFLIHVGLNFLVMQTRFGPSRSHSFTESTPLLFALNAGSVNRDGRIIGNSM